MSWDHETEALVKRAAHEAARQAVTEMLVSLGLDASKPIQVQRNMAFIEGQRILFEDPEYAADQAHLRRWRKTVEGIQNKGMITAVGLLVSGLIAAVWLGFLQLIPHK